jgi:hypothetical protein|tara:strand:+ start:462 stop:683 length:222 start_codon:yes stop_codon:yes gene_type:complete
MKTEQDELKEILIKHNALNKDIDYILDSGIINHALYSYFADTGDMPYNVMKGHDGSTDEWIADKLYESGLIKE